MPPTPALSAQVMPMKKRLGLIVVIIAMTLLPALIMLAITYVGTGKIQTAGTRASLPAVAGIAAAALFERRFAVSVAVVTGGRCRCDARQPRRECEGRRHRSRR